MRTSSYRAAGAASLVLLTSGGAIAACQTPTSITFAYRTDVDCAEVGPRIVGVVVGAADTVAEVLEPTTIKECIDAPPAGGLLEIGSVVALPGEGTETVVGMKVILGVNRPTDECGVVADADGQPWGGCIVARRRLAFLDGAGLTVDVPLYRDCIGIPCDEDRTCVPGRGCVDAELSPEDCLGSACGVDDLGSGSSSVATGATTGATTTGEGGSTSSATTGGGEGGVGGAGGTGGVGGAGSTSSTSSTGGEGGAPPECTNPRQCTVADPTCLTPTCIDGRCGSEIEVGAPCTGERVVGMCNAQGQCCEGLDCEETPDGTPCTNADICVSANCVDGFCCNSVCGGTCESCRGADTNLDDGTCGDVRPGLDPANECPGDCGACSAGLCSVIAPCAGSCLGADEGASCDACQPNGWVQGGTCQAGQCIGFDPVGISPPPAPQGPPEPCPGNFSCVDGQGCLTQCTEPADCLLGFECTPQGTCE